MSLDMFNIDIHDARVKFIEAKPSGWAGYIPVSAMLEALAAEGIPEALYPNVPSDNKCAERAMTDLREGKRYMIRPLPRSRGWSLVIENGDALDLEQNEELQRVGAGQDIQDSHKVELTCKVERALTDGQLSTIRITPDDHPAVALVHEAFRFHRGTDDENRGMFQASADLSVWFSQTIIPWVHGVATRSRGGSYYVLRGVCLHRLEKVCRALERVSTYEQQVFVLPDGQQLKRTKTVRGGRIILKPELATQASCEVLLDSIINEMDKRVDVLAAKLQDGSLGVRALTTQTAEVEAWQKELSQWEDMLGVAMTDITARLAESEAGVGMARLKLEAEKDSKKEAA